MTRQYSRRATLTVIGAGLAGLTGAITPGNCAVVFGNAACDAPLSLSGPDAVTLAADATDPRFVLRNETDDAVRVSDATWTVYRRENGWDQVDSGASSDGSSDRSSGAAVTLAPGAETAWAVLVRAENAGYAMQTTATTASSTTRYVGPVSLSPGTHAFVVSGRVDGGSFDVAARFTVE